MPFKSKAQRRACYATKGFNGKVSCEEWEEKTGKRRIPERVPKRKKR